MKFWPVSSATLIWTSAIMWDSGIAHDALWERPHASFTTEDVRPS